LEPDRWLPSTKRIVRGLKEAQTEDERYALAEHVVARLKEHGDPWAEGQTDDIAKGCEGPH
jgi:hypothetical protein